MTCSLLSAPINSKLSNSLNLVQMSDMRTSCEGMSCAYKYNEHEQVQEGV